MTEKIKDVITEEVETSTAPAEEQKEVAPKKKKMLALGIIAAVIFFAATVFLTWTIIEVFLDVPAPGQPDTRALGYLLIVLTYGAILYGISLVVNIAALVVAIINFVKKKVEKGTLIYFIVMAVLPIIMWVVFYLLTFLLNVA